MVGDGAEGTVAGVCWVVCFSSLSCFSTSLVSSLTMESAKPIKVGRKSGARSL